MVRKARILLKDVLKYMEAKDEDFKPVPFSLVACTLDSKKGTGGEFVIYSNAVLSKNQSTSDAPSDFIPDSDNAFSPKHSLNDTRNLLLLDSMQVRKINIRLIIEFNNKEVIW